MIWIKPKQIKACHRPYTGTNYAVPPTVNPSMRKVG